MPVRANETTEAKAAQNSSRFPALLRAVHFSEKKNEEGLPAVRVMDLISSTKCTSHE